MSSIPSALTVRRRSFRSVRTAGCDGPGGRAGRPLVAAALLLAALNLRLPIAAVPPVLSQVRHVTGLSSAGGGVLTAIPVLCFGLLGLGTPALLRRMGMGPALGLVLVAVVAGSAVRLFVPVGALFAGTVLIGGAIAAGNVIVPALIKRDFGARRATMTALYSAALSLGGGLSAGLTVPVEHLTGWGWRAAVAVWALLALIGLAVWLPHASDDGAPERSLSSKPRIGDRTEVGSGTEGAFDAGIGLLWRDRLAWAVTAFMGLQSLGFYSTLSWIPTLLEGHGVSAGTAGWLLSFATIPGLAAALLTPGLERRLARPALLVWVAAGCIAVAYVGLLAAPAPGAYVWMGLLGLGQGASLSLALGYIVARSGDGAQAARLSTMAQGVGYTVAAAGPFAIGALHGLTGGWTVPFGLLLALLVPFVAVGRIAAQPVNVLTRRRT